MKYAYNTVSLEESEETLQVLMNKLTNETAIMDFEVNNAKTQTMDFSRNPENNDSINIIVKGVNRETTQQYTMSAET